MTTPSATQVPSKLPQDLLFNAEKIDEAVNSSALSYPDRFGVHRLTLAGAVDAIKATNPRGAWATATGYALKDVVTSGGIAYICVEAHTSGGTFAGDLATKWRVYQGALVSDLTDPTNGDAGLAVQHPATGGGVRTQHQKNQDFLSLEDFAGADPTGAGDSTTAINNATAAAVLYKKPLHVNGHFRHTSTITVPAFCNLVGAGITDDIASGARAPSCFIKDFNGVGFLFSGDCASTDGIQYDSTAGKTGDGVQVTGSRVHLISGATTNHGNDGLRVGATEAGASSINANLGFIGRWVSLKNGRHGVNFDHTNTTTSVTYPLGAPDVNAWTVEHLSVGSDTRGNAGDGLHIGNAIDSTFINVVAQSNTGRAIRCTSGARGHRFIGTYSETNTAGGPLFESGARNNMLLGTSGVITGNDVADNDGSNLVFRNNNNSSTLGVYFNYLKVANLAAAGAAPVQFYADTNSDNVANIKGGLSGASGGLLTVEVKQNGGALRDALTVNENGLVAFPINSTVLIGKTAMGTATGIELGDGGGRANFIQTTAGARTFLTFRDASGLTGSISTTGAGVTAYNTSSDYRLKRDFTPMDGAAALALLAQIRVGNFTWVGNGAAGTGVLAHELQAIKPDAVHGLKDATETIDGVTRPLMQGVDYSKLVPELIAGLNHLAAEFAAYKASHP